MTTIRSATVFAVILLTANAALAQAPANAEATRAVFAAESSFAASMAKRDLAAFEAHLASDAIFFGGASVSRGKAAVIAAWRPFFDGPSAPFSWRPQTVEVLESGSLAHSSGPVFDANGRQTATFNSVWRRDPDGRWRVVFDKGCPAPPVR